MITILRQEWQQGPCPACGQPIQMELAVDLAQLADIPAGRIDAVQVNATLAGVRLSHDCIPKATRDPIAVDQRPHSRACGMHAHPHGPDCHSNCPTCHGKVGAAEQLRATVRAAQRAAGQLGLTIQGA